MLSHGEFNFFRASFRILGTLNDRYHMALSHENHSLMGFLVIFSPTQELLVEKVVAQCFSCCNPFPSSTLTGKDMQI